MCTLHAPFQRGAVELVEQLWYPFSRMLQADSEVVEILTPYRATYRDPLGNLQSHVFDFLVRYLDGRLLAYTLALSREVAEVDIRIRHVRACGLKDIDRCVVLTERDVRPDAFANANKILHARPRYDRSQVELALADLLGMGGVLRFGDLAALGERPRLRRIAIWNLVDRKSVRPQGSGLIGPDTVLAAASPAS